MLVRRYDSRRPAKDTVTVLQRLGLIARLAVRVTATGEVYISCDPTTKAAEALLSTGTAADLPDPAQVVELYQGEAVKRFRANSGGGMVGAKVGAKSARRGAAAR